MLGLRFNVWTSIVLFVLATAWFVYAGRRWPSARPSLYVDGRAEPPVSVPTAETEEPRGEPL